MNHFIVLHTLQSHLYRDSWVRVVWTLCSGVLFMLFTILGRLAQPKNLNGSVDTALFVNGSRSSGEKSVQENSNKQTKPFYF